MDWLEKVKSEALKIGDEVGKAVDAGSKKLDEQVAKLDKSGGDAATGAPGAPAAWLADPTKRHQLRYWDGSAWTEHVSDDGKTSTDPV